jgi:hypothetical protein
VSLMPSSFAAAMISFSSFPAMISFSGSLVISHFPSASLRQF